MTNTTARNPDESRIEPPPRELDSRLSDGIHVQLLWYPQDGHVSVAVTDSKTGVMFELEVPHGHRPLHVFHHPYAYHAETHDPGRLAAQSPR